MGTKTKNKKKKVNTDRKKKKDIFAHHCQHSCVYKLPVLFSFMVESLCVLLKTLAKDG